MIIYIIVFLFLAYFAWAYQNKRIKKLSIVPFLFLLFLVALRDENVGIDTHNYVSFFTYGMASTLKTESEYGFAYWMDFLKAFSKSGDFFIFATSCLCMIPLWVCIKKNSSNPYLSLLLFMIYEGGMGLFMLAMRQAIAVSFCFLALFLVDFSKKRSVLVAGIIVFIASLFHTSALTCFGFILLSKIPLGNQKIKILLLIISAFVGLFLRINFFSFLPDLLQIGIFANNASFYEEYTSLEVGLNFNGLITEIMPISVLIYFVVKYMKDNTIQRVSYWSVVLVNIFANTPFLPRFFVYGILPIIILVPNCYNSIPTIERNILNWFILIMFLFFLLYTTTTYGIDEYASYLL